MFGFRFRFNVPSDEAGSPKIPLSRIVFLATALLLLGVGLWQAWRYLHLTSSSQNELQRISERLLEAKVMAGLCALIFVSTGGFFLWLALAAEHSLRKNNVSRDDNPMFVSARQFTLVAGVVGFLYIFGFLIAPALLRFLPGLVVAMIWVVCGAALCNGILWLFRKKPHAAKDCEIHLAKGAKTKPEKDDRTSPSV